MSVRVIYIWQVTPCIVGDETKRNYRVVQKQMRRMSPMYRWVIRQRKIATNESLAAAATTEDGDSDVVSAGLSVHGRDILMCIMH